MESTRIGEFSTHRAFSAQAFEWVLSSNIFNPSNCYQRVVKDRGSLCASVPGETFDIFEAKKKRMTPLTHMARVARAVLRCVAGFFIQLTAAPFGVLYHGGSLALHFVKYLAKGGSWERVKSHAAAFFTDAVVTLFGGLSLGSTMFCLTGGLRWIVTLISKKQIIELVGVCVLALTANSIPIATAVAYQDVLPLFITYSSERAGFYKSVMFKNRFGITGPNGRLLTWNTTDDQEHLKDFSRGHIGDLYIQKCLTLLFAIQDLQRELPSGERLQFDALFKENAAARMMKAHSNDPFDGEFKVSRLIDHLRVIHPDRVDRFQVLADHIARLKDTLSTILKLQRTSVCNNRDVEVTLPFPWKKEYCEQFFNCAIARQKSDWEVELARENSELESILKSHSLDQLPFQFQEVIARMREARHPSELLGIKERASRSELRQAFRSVRHFHPDKLTAAPQHVRDLGAIVFRSLNAAYHACDHLLNR